jgi:hypothetical protein
MRWANYVAGTGTGEVRAGFWWRYLMEGDHLEDLGVDGKIIFKWIFKNWVGEP